MATELSLFYYTDKPGVLAIKNTNNCSGMEKGGALQESETEIIEGILESKDRYRKVVQAGIAKWIKDFQAGRIKINTVDDLKKLVELDILLQKESLILNKRRKSI